MQNDYESYDVVYAEECAILRGQALQEAFPEKDAVTLLQEQARRALAALLFTKCLSRLPMPSQAEVHTFEYDIEIGKASDGTWFYILWTASPYPWHSAEGFATADEALQAALEI